MDREDSQHSWHGDRLSALPEELLAHYLQGGLPESDSVAVVTLLAPAASAKGEVELQECRDVVGPNSLQVDGEWGYPTGLPYQGAILCQEERWELEVAEEFHPIPSHPSCSISPSYLIC